MTASEAPLCAPPPDSNQGTGMICAGIDAGSRAIKIVLMDGQSRCALGSITADQGVEQDALVATLLDRLLVEQGLRRRDVQRTVATGYARHIISAADKTITEITCHARGVHHQAPKVRTIVEIGGQDSKLLKLDGAGRVEDFAMNDRCAAGTGRFLEMVADRVGVPLAALGELARKSTNPARITSMCVVFAETEIIGLLAQGRSAPDIVAGVQASIAQRVGAMTGRNVVPPVVLTGGVAMVGGMDSQLAVVLGQPVAVAANPQMTGALGAALLACDQAHDRPPP